MMFFNNKDNMIRTASRTAILKIIMCNRQVVNDKEINEYIIESGFIFSINFHLEKVIYLNPKLKTIKC